MLECVSVVIPSYNRAHILEQTIPSYFQKNVGEVILVDDCSSDNTREVVKNLQQKYTKLKYIHLEKNSKQTVAKNIGKSQARYPYIYFGDDDSFITDDTITILLETMKKYNADVVGAKALYMNNVYELDDINSFIQKNSKIVEVDSYMNIENLFYISFDFNVEEPTEVLFCPACALVKSDIAKQFDFSREYKGNCFREETDFFTKISANGYKIVYDSRAIQINLPREMISSSYSMIRKKIRNSYYEFLNTFKYLKNNREIISEYYKNKNNFKKIWIKYMYEAVTHKTKRLFEIFIDKSKTEI